MAFRLTTFAVICVAFYALLAWLYAMGPAAWLFSGDNYADFLRDTVAGLVGAFFGVLLALEAERMRTDYERKGDTIILLRNLHHILDRNVVHLKQTRERLTHDVSKNLIIVPPFLCEVTPLASTAAQRGELLQLSTVRFDIDNAHFWLENVNRYIPLLTDHFVMADDNKTLVSAQWLEEVYMLFDSQASTKPLVAALKEAAVKDGNHYRVRSDLPKFIRSIGATLVTVTHAEQKVEEAIESVEAELAELGWPAPKRQDK